MLSNPVVAKIRIRKTKSIYGYRRKICTRNTSRCLSQKQMDKSVLLMPNEVTSVSRNRKCNSSIAVYFKIS
jgi:hypothetical protein